MATTCAALGYECGMIPDGCGGSLDCGACTAPAACGGGGKPNVCGASSGVQTYTTSFLLTEDPISEGGHWVNYTILSSQGGVQYGVKDGDVIEASIVGTTITVHLNGVQVNQASDGAYPTGSPGLGFDFTQPGLVQNYGLSSYTVTAQ
jgi:hypothetical protein